MQAKLLVAASIRNQSKIYPYLTNNLFNKYANAYGHNSRISYVHMVCLSFNLQ